MRILRSLPIFSGLFCLFVAVHPALAASGVGGTGSASGVGGGLQLQPALAADSTDMASNDGSLGPNDGSLSRNTTVAGGALFLKGGDAPPASAMAVGARGPTIGAGGLAVGAALAAPGVGGSASVGGKDEPAVLSTDAKSLEVLSIGTSTTDPGKNRMVFRPGGGGSPRRTIISTNTGGNRSLPEGSPDDPDCQGAPAPKMRSVGTDSSDLDSSRRNSPALLPLGNPCHRGHWPDQQLPPKGPATTVEPTPSRLKQPGFTNKKSAVPSKEGGLANQGRGKELSRKPKMFTSRRKMCRLPPRPNKPKRQRRALSAPASRGSDSVVASDEESGSSQEPAARQHRDSWATATTSSLSAMRGSWAVEPAASVLFEASSKAAGEQLYNTGDHKRVSLEGKEALQAIGPILQVMQKAMHAHVAAHASGNDVIDMHDRRTSGSKSPTSSRTTAGDSGNERARQHVLGGGLGTPELGAGGSPVEQQEVPTIIKDIGAPLGGVNDPPIHTATTTPAAINPPTKRPGSLRCISRGASRPTTGRPPTTAGAMQSQDQPQSPGCTNNLRFQWFEVPRDVWAHPWRDFKPGELDGCGLGEGFAKAWADRLCSDSKKRDTSCGSVGPAGRQQSVDTTEAESTVAGTGWSSAASTPSFRPRTMSYGGRSLGGLSDDGPAPGRGRSASLTPPGARPPRPPNGSRASSTRDPQRRSSFGSQSSGVKSRSPPSKFDPPPTEFRDELNGDFLLLPVSAIPLDEALPEADGSQGEIWQDPYAHGEEQEDGSWGQWLPGAQRRGGRRDSFEEQVLEGRRAQDTYRQRRTSEWENNPLQRGQSESLMGGSRDREERRRELMGSFRAQSGRSSPVQYSPEERSAVLLKLQKSLPFATKDAESLVREDATTSLPSLHTIGDSRSSSGARPREGFGCGAWWTKIRDLFIGKP